MVRSALEQLSLVPLWLALPVGLVLTTGVGHAQDVEALRAAATVATEEGRLPDAYQALQDAAQHSDDPGLLLELAEVAGHLRIDDVALEAYRAFLEAAPNSPRRREIAGRIDALTRVNAGHRFGAPLRSQNYVVDWQGRPIVPRPRADAPHSELVSWDGSPLRAERTGPDGSASLAAQLTRPY